MLDALARPPSAVTIAFVGARTMRSLNARYRGRHYPTDVLSFPYPGEIADGVPFLGDVVIAPDVAARNAQRCGGRVEGELRKLLVHGLLHLLGYDHETDDGEMLRLQGRLLRRPRLATARLLVDPVAPKSGVRP